MVSSYIRMCVRTSIAIRNGLTRRTRESNYRLQVEGLSVLPVAVGVVKLNFLRSWTSYDRSFWNSFHDN
jgi:hypothetical protein